MPRLDSDAGADCQGSGFTFQVLRVMIQGSGFMVYGSGFRVQGSEFRVQGSGLKS